MAINPLRGEVAFTVGGVKAFAVWKMDTAMRWSDSLGNPSFNEILRRIREGELRALGSFVEIMTVNTDVDAVKEQMSLHVTHLEEVIFAASKLLQPFLAEKTSKKE
jgi:hypothetical protein